MRVIEAQESRLAPLLQGWQTPRVFVGAPQGAMSSDPSPGTEKAKIQVSQ
jgi:hypothetical protein